MRPLERILWIIGLALLVAIIFAPRPVPAQTAPPAPEGLTTQARGLATGTTWAGTWGAAWVPDGWGDWRLVRWVARTGYVLRHPAPGSSGAETLVQAYWRANVAQDCGTTTDVYLIDLCAAALREAQATLPLPLWVVRPNGTYTTRPTYPVIAGVRSRIANGTVEIRDASGRPTACNPAETIREGASTYMQVERSPGTVALCSPS